ncbi:hypothetical protein [Paenibacillus sp. FSL K6-2859]
METILRNGGASGGDDILSLLISGCGSQRRDCIHHVGCSRFGVITLLYAC